MDVSAPDVSPTLKLHPGQVKAREIGGRIMGATLGQRQGRDVEAIIDEVEWLENWSRRMCEISGVSPGDPEFEQCQREWAEKALGSPDGLPLGAPLEHHENIQTCGACGSRGALERLAAALRH